MKVLSSVWSPNVRDRVATEEHSFRTPGIRCVTPPVGVVPAQGEGLVSRGALAKAGSVPMHPDAGSLHSPCVSIAGKLGFGATNWEDFQATIDPEVITYGT